MLKSFLSAQLWQCICVYAYLSWLRIMEIVDFQLRRYIRIAAYFLCTEEKINWTSRARKIFLSITDID